MTLTDFLAIFGAATGLTSLIVAFRKDVHHVRLEVQRLDYGALALNVNNDSACAFGVLAVGVFDSQGKVKWIGRVGSYVTNGWLDYPIRVEPRSLCSLLMVSPRDVPPPSKPQGFIVQLETGRVYVLRHTAPFGAALRMHFSSLVSRMSRGAWLPWIPKRPRLPTQRRD